MRTEAAWSIRLFASCSAHALVVLPAQMHSTPRTVQQKTLMTLVIQPINMLIMVNNQNCALALIHVGGIKLATSAMVYVMYVLSREFVYV